MYKRQDVTELARTDDGLVASPLVKVKRQLFFVLMITFTCFIVQPCYVDSVHTALLNRSVLFVVVVEEVKVV